MTLFDRNPNSRSYAAGATIVTQGDPGDFIYVITADQVDVLSDGELLAERLRERLPGEPASSAAADDLPEDPPVGMHATLFARWLTHPDGGLSAQWVTVAG